MARKRGNIAPSEMLFAGDQQHLFEKSYEEKLQTEKNKTVECLGMTFENDEKRREYFLEKLREKFKDPDFRKIEGFPIGSDEDILALSDPPYYTACPNPFIADFVKHYGKPYDPSKPYSREPFAVDVSEGKTDPIYKAHSYHTKVPHLAIVPSILHYTEPGDVVLDGFCGSGMTGVAAQWCGCAPEAYRRKVEADFEKQGMTKPAWGARRVVLNDLSPAATFIAANYNLPFDVCEFAKAGKQILEEVEREIGWMYETLHTDGKTKGRIEYTVWSEVFTCPDCAGEVVFLDEALDEDTKRVKDTFPCPHCGSELTKKRLDRSYEARFDPILKKAVQTPKRKPSLIVYSLHGKRHEKTPDEYDLALLERIAILEWPPEVPSVEIPPMHMTHERARMDRQGITHIHHFFLSRAAHALAALWCKANAHPDARIRHMLLFFVEQAITSLNIQNRYGPHRYSQSNGAMPLVYYVPSQISEVSPWYVLGGKLERLRKTWANPFSVSGASLIQAGTMARLLLPDNCIDYIFTDPPFGENIYYADLNFLVESWHRLITNAAPEAIVDKFKKKGLPEYQHREAVKESVMDQKRVADQRNLDAPMAIRSGIWAWSPDHGQLCQVIEAQTLWGETTCRVWLPGRDSVVRIPASRLRSLESVGAGSPDDIVYVVAAARVADALTQDHRQGRTGFLLAPIESSVIPLPHQIQGRNFSEKLPLIRIFLEGTGHE